MKKSGSILIEIVASIAILLMTITFAVNTCLENKKILKERILNEEVTRTTDNLINEFKYNVAKERIEQMLTDGNGEIGIKYSKNLSEVLIDKDISELEQGNDIEINKIDDDDSGLMLRVIAQVKDGEGQVTVEKEFTKSWWMDEV